ncbi:MAG TPA: PilZ domain-containing protein [Thermoanaerobaculia bacterium]
MGKGPEHRKHPRVRPRGVVAHVRSPRAFGCQVENLSMGGAFLRTDQIVSIGSTIEMDLVKPGGRKALRLTGRVVRIVQPESAAQASSAPGIAVEFDVHELEVATRLQELLATLGVQSGKEGSPSGPPPPPAPIQVQVQIQTQGQAPASNFEKEPPPAARGTSPLTPELFEKPLPQELPTTGPVAEAGSDPARLMVQIRGLLFELGEVRARLEEREAELREARAELATLRGTRSPT